MRVDRRLAGEAMDDFEMDRHSISDTELIRLKNFVTNLINNFETGPDAIHVD